MPADHIPPTKADYLTPLERELSHEINRLCSVLQRYKDLIRHQRNELHTAGLISDDEYAGLAEDAGAVERLESYDAARDENVRLRALCGRAAEPARLTSENYKTMNATRQALRDELRAASEGR